MRTRPALWLAAAASFLAVVPAVLAAPSPDTAGRGQDVSWPQCTKSGSSHAGPLPADAAFGIVGTQNGTPNTANPCLAEEWAWAAALPQPPGLYLLPGNPGPDKTQDGKGLSDDEHNRWKNGSVADASVRPRPCSGSAGDDGCAYDYGWQAALNALANVDAAGLTVTPVAWWMDVEPASFYRTKDAAALAQNLVALQGTRDALLNRPDRVASVGIYAAPIGNWKAITGGDTSTFSTLPYWYPVGDDGLAAAVSHCNQVSPAGGPVTQVQWTDDDDTIGKTFDQDVRCATTPAASPLTFTFVPSVVRSGTTLTITGRASAGAALSVHQKEVGVPEHEATTTVAATDGTWSATLVQHTNGYVSVFDGSGGINRKISVTTGVGITRISRAGLTSTGLCKVRLDGGVSPWLPGQVVQVTAKGKQLGFAHTRKRGGTQGSFSLTLKLACGKPVTVTPVLPGKAGSVSYAQTSRGTPRVLKPRR